MLRLGIKCYGWEVTCYAWEMQNTLDSIDLLRRYDQEGRFPEGSGGKGPGALRHAQTASDAVHNHPS